MVESTNDAYKKAMELYKGNPNYLTLLPNGKTYEDVTLDDLGLNIDGIKAQLFPMDDKDLVDNEGNPYPDSLYQSILEQCVALVEKKFDICIRPRLVIDRKDYEQNDYNTFVNLRLSQRPILHVEDISLMFNSQHIFTFQDDWIKAYTRTGQVQIQPNAFLQAGLGAPINAILPVMTMPYGFDMSMTPNNQHIPQMIGVQYVAGMLPQPQDDRGINRDCYITPDLISYICKFGAVEVLERWGRTPIGAGIAGYSVSVDGISSSITSTASAENSSSSGEIRNLLDDMKNLEQSLTAYYGRNVGILS